MGMKKLFVVLVSVVSVFMLVSCGKLKGNSIQNEILRMHGYDDWDKFQSEAQVSASASVDGIEPADYIQNETYWSGIAVSTIFYIDDENWIVMTKIKSMKVADSVTDSDFYRAVKNNIDLLEKNQSYIAVGYDEDEFILDVMLSSEFDGIVDEDKIISLDAGYRY